MMPSFTITILLAITGPAIVTVASEQNNNCTLVGFGEQSVLPCVENWAIELSGERSKNPKSSRIDPLELMRFVDTILQNANTTRSVIDQSMVSNRIGLSLKDYVELAAVTEPYLIYMMGDIMIGYELTASDLQKLGFRSDLAQNPDNVEQFYMKYFEEGCLVKHFESALTCMANWVDKNCGMNGQNVKQLLTSLSGYYCSGANISPSLKKTLKRDLGKVWKPVMDIFLRKDSNSPLVFTVNFEENSEKFKQLQQVNCTSSINSVLGYGLASTINNATLDDGFMTIKSALSGIANCYELAIHKIFPGALTKESACQALGVIKRYGIEIRSDILKCSGDYLFGSQTSAGASTKFNLSIATLLAAFIVTALLS